ncbi:MAG: hypothetical protein WC768_02940 [Patescibacteria group bacterium]
MNKNLLSSALIVILAALMNLGCPPPKTYMLTLSVNPADSGTAQASPNQSFYAAGTVVTLTATAQAATDWVFDHWEGEISDNYANPTTVAMTKNQNVIAVFVSQELTDLAVQEITLPCGLTAVLIDEAGNFREDTAIATDSQGKVHLVYRLSDNDGSYLRHLAYATNASGKWQMKKDWVNYAFGTYSAIAIDNNDKVHICATGGNGAGENVVYATNVTGHWTDQDIDRSPSSGLECDIAIDAANKPHLSYWQWSGDNLRYATNASGSWLSEEVDGGSVYWVGTSIMIDSAGKTNIVYSGNGYVRLATEKPDTWDIQTIDAITSYSKTAAVMGSQDQLYILHDGGLASRIGGIWIDDKIFAAMLEGITFTPRFDRDGIVLDAAGYLHLAFEICVDKNDGGYDYYLYYATNLNGEWQAVKLDSWEGDAIGELGTFPPAITTDVSGNAHIAYVRSQTDNYQVVYCRFDPAWLIRR